MARIRVEGRDVHHQLGTKTQTVSICTAQNQKGVYEDRYSLPITVDVAAAELQGLAGLDAVREWVVLHGGQPLSTDGRPGDGLPPLLEAPPVENPWVTEAMAAVEKTVYSVVETFRQQPYLHRVEHSLHAHLWSLLKQHPLLQDEVVLQDGSTRTQLVHKEWPETHPRTKPDGTLRPRGLFDLAILSPEQVHAATVEQLTFGRIEAPIVIEVGLDYGFEHLEQDICKLRNSEVHAAYVLHLSRVRDARAADTERLLCERAHGIRTAYVQVGAPGITSCWKHVHDTQVVS